MTALISKPGITSVSTLSIPKDWDKTWFRNFIQNQLKGADVRNAIGVNGITITGNISTPYATIAFGAGPIVITGGGSGAALTIKEGSSGLGLDIWAGVANGTALIQGFNSTGSTRTGYLAFLSGTGGGGGATETGLDNDGTTVNDWLSLITGGVRRVRVDGTGHVIINAPGTSGVTALTVNGSATAFPLFLNSPAAATTSGIVLEQGGSITAEIGADGSQTMWAGSVNGDFVLRQISGTIWIVVNSTTLALSISSTGAIDFHSVATTTTAPGAGGAGALPATPAGYATFSIAGVARKIAFY